MPQPNYNLHLKGYVGGCDFDRNYVDYVLAKNKDKPVHVLIDSLGGRTDTALSADIVTIIVDTPGLTTHERHLNIIITTG